MVKSLPVEAFRCATLEYLRYHKNESTVFRLGIRNCRCVLGEHLGRLVVACRTSKRESVVDRRSGNTIAELCPGRRRIRSRSRLGIRSVDLATVQCEALPQ